MAHSVNFYYNSYKENVINKSLSNAWSCSCHLVDVRDVSHPIIKVDINNYNANVNYAYIKDFSRYYFITKKERASGQFILLHLETDVLKSFNLNGIEGILDRSTNLKNEFIPDNKIKASAFPKQGSIYFDNGFTDNGTFILATQGGV